ncbi:MAG: hypothetical protein KDE33_03430 [Bacteroidetes bacterium]|nr:hypothetical protein [Bacteroidota bacterium]
MEEQETFENFDNTEKQGQKNILHYFDRIHDKLFTFNNILIAGYFALSQFDINVSIKTIIIPIINLIYLIYLEYRMMELSQAESNVKNIPLTDLDRRLFSKYSKVTLFSFGAILSTTAVTGYFLYIIFI